MKKIILLLAAFYAGAAGASVYSFDSPYFSYEEDDCRCLCLCLSYQGVTKKGASWRLRNLTPLDEKTLSHIQGDPRVMIHFADGKPRTPEQTNEQVTLIRNRYQSGIPKGGWAIDVGGVGEEHMVGLLTLGASSAPKPGRAEMGRKIAFEDQGTGIGTSVMDAVVKEMGPEIRRWGLQQDLPLIKERFTCYEGQALSEIYVTSAPANVGSWLTQVRSGFKPMKRVKEEDPIVLHYESSGIEDFGALQNALLNRFKEDDLVPEKPYKLFDIKGDKRTVSYVEKYDSVRYHFTYSFS
ncbi:MAG: GNAT family N-acetyltransferase [Alphaproteobacteria bacterium]|nr:GNAT family N-acetyltransferase [Alphaproteobacteria bacterium]